MTGEEAAFVVIDALDALGISYMLGGSMASNFYGSPNATESADFFIQVGHASFDELKERLEPFFSDRQTALEMASTTFRQVLYLPDDNCTIELFLLSSDEYDQERFRRRVRVGLLDHSVCLPTAEDVVITKVYWVPTHTPTIDRSDVRNVIALQGERLDWLYIYSWADRHGTREMLEQIRGEIPPH